MRPSLSNPFYGTRSQVVDLARRRYFEEGVPPAGVLSEVVFQSWTRCQRLHDHPERPVDFQPVTQSRTQLALQRNRALLQAWLAEVPSLQVLLGKTTCAAMLTDATGVLIGASCAGRPHENLMPVATRLGVDLSEEAVGTTAPGIVVRTGKAVSVLGSEHFFDHMRKMHCAAAPIRDTQGCLAGVLDLSSESIEFGFDAAAVVDYLARNIENRFLVAQSAKQLVLRIHVAPSLLDSYSVGLVGLREDGRVAWLNTVASKLLGLPPLNLSDELPPAEQLLGHSFSSLAVVPRQGAATLSLPNGLSLWARSELRDNAGKPEPLRFPMQGNQACATRQTLPSEPNLNLAEASASADVGVPDVSPNSVPATPLTVRVTHKDLLQKALQESHGNVSETARRLGVSRGWVYRRLDSASSTG